MKLIIRFLIAAGVGICQTAFDPNNPDRDKHLPDANGIAARLAASDFVVTGTVERVGSIFTRLYKSRLPEYEKLAQEGRAFIMDNDTLDLYVIRVDSTLCRKSDFQPNSARMPQLKDIYLVNPHEGALAGFHLAYRNEFLQSGTRYLFSLGVDPEVDAKMEKYDLDPKLPYYRVLHHSDGAIQLPTAEQRGNAGAFKPFGYQSDKDLATPVLNIATAICQAVQPPNTLQKTDGLERLKSSPDPTTRQNADIALKLLRGEPIR